MQRTRGDIQESIRRFLVPLTEEKEQDAGMSSRQSRKDTSAASPGGKTRAEAQKEHKEQGSRRGGRTNTKSDNKTEKGKRNSNQGMEEEKVYELEGSTLDQKEEGEGAKRRSAGKLSPEGNLDKKGHNSRNAGVEGVQSTPQEDTNNKVYYNNFIDK